MITSPPVTRSPPGAHDGRTEPALAHVLALSWFEHRRTVELCRGLGIGHAGLKSRRRGARRYLELTVRTLAVLLRRRPRVVLVQNPSLVSALLMLGLRFVLRHRVIVDAHNEAVVPYENRSSLVARASRWVIRRADLTLVTNRQLAEIVAACGGRPFVLPDRVPDPPSAPRPVTRTAAFRAVLIATFARDEPVAAIFEAVRNAPLELHVTGDPARLPRSVSGSAPDNVHFTGFLPEGEYWELLRSADVIIDLTLKPDCLVCGAYEALALAKPMVLSGNRASIELFGEAALFTDNSPPDIRAALERVRQDPAAMQERAARRRAELQRRWPADAERLRSVMLQLAGPS